MIKMIRKIGQLNEDNSETCVECENEMTDVKDMRYDNDTGHYLCESCAKLSIYKYNDIRFVEE
jgi:hypothetical protein